MTETERGRVDAIAASERTVWPSPGAGAQAGAGRRRAAPGGGRRKGRLYLERQGARRSARYASAWARRRRWGRPLTPCFWAPPLGERSVARVGGRLVPLDGAGVGLRRPQAAGSGGPADDQSAVGPLAVILDSGAVLYSRPAVGPSAMRSYVLPGSVRSEAPDSRSHPRDPAARHGRVLPLTWASARRSKAASRARGVAVFFTAAGRPSRSSGSCSDLAACSHGALRPYIGRALPARRRLGWCWKIAWTFSTARAGEWLPPPRCCATRKERRSHRTTGPYLVISLQEQHLWFKQHGAISFSRPPWPRAAARRWSRREAPAPGSSRRRAVAWWCRARRSRPCGRPRTGTTWSSRASGAGPRPPRSRPVPGRCRRVGHQGGGNDVVRAFSDGAAERAEGHGRPGDRRWTARLLIPPLGTTQRRYEGVLGTHRLNLGTDTRCTARTSRTPWVLRSAMAACACATRTSRKLHPMVPGGHARLHLLRGRGTARPARRQRRHDGPGVSSSTTESDRSSSRCSAPPRVIAT